MAENKKSDEMISHKKLVETQNKTKEQLILNSSDRIIKRMEEFTNGKDKLNENEILIIEEFRRNKDRQKNTIHANLLVKEDGEVGTVTDYYKKSITKVPKYVDEFMVIYHDEKKKNIREAFEIIAIMKLEYPKVFQWSIDYPDKFADAWLNGRDVLPDKLFITQVPNPQNSDEPLYLVMDEEENISLVPQRNVLDTHKITLTDEEIEPDFSWFKTLGLSVEVPNVIYGLNFETEEKERTV
ncbi:DUF1642 domain-containing protein [Streptococcus agalactiae]|nr:DUF1642 domain-containing protein [Streptococcus agalactiae]